MNWGEQFKSLRMCRVWLPTLMMLCMTSPANALQCIGDPAGPGAPNGRAASLRSAVKGVLGAGPENAAYCRHAAPPAIPENHLYMLAMYASARHARSGQTGVEDPVTGARVEPSEQGMTPQIQTALQSRFDIRWRPNLGPEWVHSVPSWVIDDAKNYKRRGLPILHLWESSHYLVALGLSSHGKPGIYFSQKLP